MRSYCNHPKSPGQIKTAKKFPESNRFSHRAYERKDSKCPMKSPVSSDKYIFGDSIALSKLLQQIELVGPTNYSVIIYGESGSGKEAIAQEIHKRSKTSESHLWP